MLNSKDYNFQFFLGDSKEVNTLEEGALKNGGATKFKNKIVSNIETDDIIRVNNQNNQISIFIPSTIDVDKEIDNKLFVKEVISRLRKRYELENLSFYNTKGSWFDECGKQVVIEKITIISVDMAEVTDLDIRYFINIAIWLKSEMKQQGISISINNALAII